MRSRAESIAPWSPLASGFLTGKCQRVDGKITGWGRVFEYKDSGNPTLEKFSKREKNWEILEAVVVAARQTGTSPTEIALAWVMSRSQVRSVLCGVTRKEQLELNPGALAIDLPPEIEQRLTEASRLESTELDHFFEPTMQGMIHGGVEVRSGVS